MCFKEYIMICQTMKYVIYSRYNMFRILKIYITKKKLYENKKIQNWNAFKSHYATKFTQRTIIDLQEENCRTYSYDIHQKTSRNNPMKINNQWIKKSILYSYNFRITKLSVKLQKVLCGMIDYTVNSTQSVKIQISEQH